MPLSRSALDAQREAKTKINRTAKRVAERLRKRSEFDDLLQIYDDDKGQVTLPARLAISALAEL